MGKTWGLGGMGAGDWGTRGFTKTYIWGHGLELEEKDLTQSMKQPFRV